MKQGRSNRGGCPRWFILVSSRSVNSLIWALLFVAIFGPGAIAGVLAIGFRSIGFVGKLLAEAFEDGQPPSGRLAMSPTTRARTRMAPPGR